MRLCPSSNCFASLDQFHEFICVHNLSRPRYARSPSESPSQGGLEHRNNIRLGHSRTTGQVAVFIVDDMQGILGITCDQGIIDR